MANVQPSAGAEIDAVWDGGWMCVGGVSGWTVLVCERREWMDGVGVCVRSEWMDGVDV